MRTRARIPSHSNALPTPFSFRLPKTGTLDPYFGLARTAWNETILPRPANNFCPLVKSIIVQKPGAKHHIRLILYDSARAYFEALAAKQTTEAA